MPNQDLRKARETYDSLRELVIRETGGWDDSASRAKVAGLCGVAISLLGDAECHELLRTVQAHAANLFSRDGHLKWSRKDMSGADFLRLQMLIGLEALNTRLFSLEALRGAGAHPAAEARP